MKSLVMSFVVILVVILVAAQADASLYQSLTDDFDTGISAATNDQNLNYAARQGGADAPNAWDDLNYNTQGAVAGWDGRVSVSDAASGHQLQVFTGINEQGLWNPGQTDLVQGSEYKVSFDAGSISGGWAFVRLNSLATGGSLECGILFSGNNVQLFHNGGIAYNPGPTVPTGANGLHHVEITVTNGIASINVDNGGWTAGANWSSIGTGTAGIGYFSIFGQGTGSVVALDNFSYQVVPEPISMVLLSLGTLGVLRRKA